MGFELWLEPPEPGRATRSAVTIAISYVVGELIPLAPYMSLNNVISALRFAVAIALLSLAVFGFVKSRFTDISPRKGAFQTVVTAELQPLPLLDWLDWSAEKLRHRRGQETRSDA